jgi:hypothetical protein
MYSAATYYLLKREKDLPIRLYYPVPDEQKGLRPGAGSLSANYRKNVQYMRCLV